MLEKETKLKIYSKDGVCPMCNMTKKWLEREGILFTDIVVKSTDEDTLQCLRDKGWRSFPVIIPNGNIKEAWTGFVPDKLKTLL